jgi:cysteine desulfurase
MDVYFDNAATTPLQKEVLEAMLPYMKEHFGNPSSIHGFGRQPRNAVEKARKTIAGHLNANTTDIFFTSGGTEANNTVLYKSVENLGVKHIISSELEHHCVLDPVQYLGKNHDVEIHYVNFDEKGHIDLNHLEKLLHQLDSPKLVSLMYANNEIGNLLEVDKVGELCQQYDAYFHTDSVQAVGHYPIDLDELNVHFLTGSAHKFHGPKGVGLLYVHPNVEIDPLIYGGGQEREMRSGTENVYGIVGMGKALDLRYQNLEQESAYVKSIKDYLKEQLEDQLEGVEFNGDPENGLYTVLNVSLPPHEAADMLLFNLDMEGIAVSAGSACSSGADAGSHVLKALGADPERPALRFSFSKYNTKEEVDYAVEKLKELYKREVTA